jgi:hypothetical protein
LTRSNKLLTRRAALRRLGLAVGTAYCSPILTGVSSAYAASAPSSSSNPTPASAPTPPSNASAPSGPENGQGSEREDLDASQSRCSAPSGSEQLGISRRDMDLANDAVARGEAKSLREIFQIVKGRHPGRMIRVGFNSNGRTRQYWLRMVTQAGSMQTVTVDALTGATVNVRGC